MKWDVTFFPSLIVVGQQGFDREKGLLYVSSFYRTLAFFQKEQHKKWKRKKKGPLSLELPSAHAE